MSECTINCHQVVTFNVFLLPVILGVTVLLCQAHEKRHGLKG